MDTSDVHPLLCYANGTKTCPVASYQKYLILLNPDIDCLWQRPSVTVTCKKSWYIKSPLGVNHLGTMMERISKRSNLSKEFTNHSVCATTINNLSEAGVEACHIAKQSGHRSLLSIDNYNKDCSETQKRHLWPVQGFPGTSRWRFSQDKCKNVNNKEKILQISL